MKRFEQKKNFNIASTVIDDNVRVSTAAIFYNDWFFGEYFQLETIIFKKDGMGNMRIHKVPCNQVGIDYCIRFHQKVVAMIKSKTIKHT